MLGEEKNSSERETKRGQCSQNERIVTKVCSHPAFWKGRKMGGEEASQKLATKVMEDQLT